MTDKIEIRESIDSDFREIVRLYHHAFPGEDLIPLVSDLLGEKEGVLSLIGIVDKELIGHAVFTVCGIVGNANKVALLGPLAIAPGWQRRGIGSTLIRAGLRSLESASLQRMYVLGDPAYYQRFGFAPDASVTPPYVLPEEWRRAWQSLALRGNAPPLEGQLAVPRPWRRHTLWAP